MKIEVLHFVGCLHYRRAVELTREVLKEEGLAAERARAQSAILESIWACLPCVCRGRRSGRRAVSGTDPQGPARGPEDTRISLCQARWTRRTAAPARTR